MLTALRIWLADLLRPALPSPPVLPVVAKPAPAVVPSAARDAGRDAERRAARLERRRHEAEEQARRAEERATAADVARKAAEERVRALDTELAQARARATSIESRAAEAAHEPPRKAGRGGARGGDSDALVEKLRAAEGRLRAMQDRADHAERRLSSTESRLATELARAEELRARLEKADGREDGRAGSAVSPRRDASGTSMDVCFSPGDDCLFAICRQIESAERSADVCVFTITDDRISARLLDAHRRGVRVRIVTDNDKAHDEGSDVHRLARAGIEVRVDETPFHMHHKFALFDGRRMLTGSYNWTRGAARDNQENVVVSDDPRLLKAFGLEFARLWETLHRA